MDRRNFIQRSSLVSLGFFGLQSFAQSCDLIRNSDPTASPQYISGYGPLMKDSKKVLNLPKHFSYKVISRKGDKMADGLRVPGLADGMAAFQGSNDRVILVRNHEVSPDDKKNGGFGAKNELLDRLSKDQFYDYGSGKYPCLGGTTTVIYNPKTQEVEKEWLSLAGTIRNCAGGKTPWGTWITCEETTATSGDILEKDHGYNFEVPASEEMELYDPIPLKDMGRFNHEAVAVDPDTGIVYQTEDRPDGLIYRFLPNTKGRLSDGGKLQILALSNYERFDTRNWDGENMPLNVKYQVEWLDIDDIDSPRDDLRYRGANKGAAVFARGEGMWYGENEFYFACTNGGQKSYGQIFRYSPSPYEGTEREIESPGTLELFIEPNNPALVDSCDNVTVAPNGDLIICEDKTTPRIVGVTDEGKIYHLAKNVGYRSEFAGATFSPDGSTLFVNIQSPGLTVAIKGPWDQRKKT